MKILKYPKTLQLHLDQLQQKNAAYTLMLSINNLIMSYIIIVSGAIFFCRMSTFNFDTTTKVHLDDT